MNSLIKCPVTYRNEQEWAEAGALLHTQMKSISWLAGDWLLWGEDMYPDTYTQMLDKWSESTLTRWAWVCKKVPPHIRREELSFTHHQAVASLGHQEQAEWLNRAVLNDYTAEELAVRIKCGNKIEYDDSQIEVPGSAQVDPAEELAKKRIPKAIKKLKLDLDELGASGKWDEVFDEMERFAL